MSLRCQINELKQRFVLNGVLAVSAKGYNTVKCTNVRKTFNAILTYSKKLKMSLMGYSIFIYL